MPIQDNLNGALLISLIDFILSFVIIGGIGLILGIFPLLNRVNRTTVQDTAKGLKEGPKTDSSPHQDNLPPRISSPKPADACGAENNLTEQQLVVILTAAACEALGEPVRVERFRRLTAKDWSWAAQGRMDLQDHRLK